MPPTELTAKDKSSPLKNGSYKWKQLSTRLPLIIIVALLAGCSHDLEIKGAVGDSETYSTPSIQGRQLPAVVVSTRTSTGEQPSKQMDESQIRWYAERLGTSGIFDSVTVRGTIPDPAKLSISLHERSREYHGLGLITIFPYLMAVLSPFVPFNEEYAQDLTIEAVDRDGKTRKYTSSVEGVVRYRLLSEPSAKAEIRKAIRTRTINSVLNQMAKDHQFYAFKAPVNPPVNASIEPERRSTQQLLPTIPQEITGSGFLVSSGYVVTNEHVIRGMPKLSVLRDGESYSASVVHQDAANDIAVLKLDREITKKLGMVLEGPASITGLRMGNAAGVRQGDHVWTLGFPLASILGERAVLAEGTVSSLSGVNGDPRFFMISVPIQPGNSGGPLLNDQGEVIGVTVSSLDAIRIFQLTGTMPQNINFAIKINYAQPLLSTLPSLEFLQPSIKRSHSPVPLSSLVEVTKPQVVLIKASH